MVPYELLPGGEVTTFVVNRKTVLAALAAFWRISLVLIIPAATLVLALRGIVMPVMKWVIAVKDAKLAGKLAALRPNGPLTEVYVEILRYEATFTAIAQVELTRIILIFTVIVASILLSLAFGGNVLWRKRTTGLQNHFRTDYVGLTAKVAVFLVLCIALSVVAVISVTSY